jgi:hypothetical protein
MSYYLSCVNFLDKQSIIDSDVTELVKIGKFCVKIWNDEVPGYGNYDSRHIDGVDNEIELTPNYQSKLDYQYILKLSNKVFEIIKTANNTWDDEIYQKYKKIFFDKYVNSTIDDKIINRKIYIIYSNDNKLQDKIQIMKEEGNIYRYHPNGYNSDVGEPWWINEFHFPHHGGDEESYYIYPYLDKFSQANDELSWRIKHKYYVIIFENKYYEVTVGRTAHA